MVTPRDDYPDGGNPPLHSVFNWPRCSCGSPLCPDTPEGAEAAGELVDDRSQSQTIRRLRPLVEWENARSRWGLL